MQPISVKQRLILILLGLFLSVVLLEVGLRIGGFILLSLQEHRNKISIKQKGAYRIMCLGESTTAFGGKDSYPCQLEEILNQRDIGIKFSVINKGMGGIYSLGIVCQLEDNLNKYKPDMVTTMMGINDGPYADVMPYEDISTSRTILFIKSFKIYKLTKLLWLHIANKSREIGMFEPRERKENITTKMDLVAEPSNYKEIENMYTKSIKTDPRNPRTYIELGGYYRDQGMFEKAEEMFKKAIEIDSESYNAYRALGSCYIDHGRSERGEEIYKKGIAIGPENSGIYEDLGYYYRDWKRYEEAEEMFRKIIEIDPKKSWAYEQLGWCYKEQNRFEEAGEMFKRAIKIEPRNIEALNGLALCYKEQGRYDLAKEYFRKVNRSRVEYYNPVTRHNYLKLKEILTQRGIRLVCVQYPMRSVEPLKKLFDSTEGIIFVDNEKIFKEALQQGKNEDYFIDNFGGDFGHCTPKGNRLLAENIANVILKRVF